jgi:hypothetical protein
MPALQRESPRDPRPERLKWVANQHEVVSAALIGETSGLESRDDVERPGQARYDSQAWPPVDCREELLRQAEASVEGDPFGRSAHRGYAITEGTNGAAEFVLKRGVATCRGWAAWPARGVPVRGV